MSYIKKKEYEIIPKECFKVVHNCYGCRGAWNVQKQCKERDGTGEDCDRRCFIGDSFCQKIL